MVWAFNLYITSITTTCTSMSVNYYSICFPVSSLILPTQRRPSREKILSRSPLIPAERKTRLLNSSLTPESPFPSFVSSHLAQRRGRWRCVRLEWKMLGWFNSFLSLWWLRKRERLSIPLCVCVKEKCKSSMSRIKHLDTSSPFTLPHLLF